MENFGDYGYGGFGYGDFNYADYFKKIFGYDLLKQPEYEPLSMLSDEDLKEYNYINNRLLEMQSEVRELTARKELFFSKLERITKIYDRKLTVENGMILVEKKPEPKSNKSKNGSDPLGPIEPQDLGSNSW